MSTTTVDPIIQKAKEIYEEKYRDSLEQDHFGSYVVIEPQSGEAFIAETSIEASLAADAAYPDREAFLLRVGYPAAFHIGWMSC